MLSFIASVEPRSASVVAGPETTPRSEVRRSCGACVACCTGTLRLTVNGQDIDQGSPCRHCATHGCGIYAARPLQCRSFECGWLGRDSPLPESMRPDCCGAILLLAKLRWRGRPVDLAIATDRRIPEHTLDWLIEHALKSRRPLIYQQDELWQCVGPREFGERVSAALANGQRLW